jgi:hypothetical protein
MHALTNAPEAAPGAGAPQPVAAHVKAAGASLPVHAGHARDHHAATGHSPVGPVAATAPVVHQQGIPVVATRSEKGKKDGSYYQGASPPVADVPRQVRCTQTESCLHSLQNC